MPMSLVGTFVVMYCFGYSLDNLSLMALTLSVGFVVDDAIVMLENIVRHMEQGKPAWQAAFKGSGEIGFTIISMTLSLVAVFIPVLFMGGILGRLLHEFAVTITASILVSGFVSLTLTPMLCSRFLKPPHAPAARAASTTRSSGCSTPVLALYDGTLRSAMRPRRRRCCAVAGAAGGHGRGCSCCSRRASSRPRTPARSSPPPKAAQGIVVRGDGRGTSRPLAEHRRGAPERRGVHVGVGAGGRRRDARTAADLHAAEAARRAAAVGRRGHRGVCGQARRSARACAPIRRIRRRSASAARSPQALYQFTLQGTDTDELYAGARCSRPRCASCRGLQDVTQRPADHEPAGAREIDRDRAALGHHRRSRSRTRSTAPTARARSRPSTRRPTSTS